MPKKKEKDWFYLFISYAKVSEKLTFVTLWYAHVHVHVIG